MLLQETVFILSLSYLSYDLWLFGGRVEPPILLGGGVEPQILLGGGVRTSRLLELKKRPRGGWKGHNVNSEKQSLS